MPECVFCQIINRKLPAKIEFEDEHLLVIHDINPQAPMHLLCISKKHYASFSDLPPESSDVFASLVRAVRQITTAHKVNSYRLLTNIGAEAGQTVMHLHWHLLAGTRFSRRHAREAVLKALYQLEFQQSNLDAALHAALHELDYFDVDEAFARQLLQSVVARRDEIDEVLQSFSKDWSLSRIGKLERSILRMALCELLWIDRVPPAVTLDEAVELTKAYCAPEAVSFVNGILGNILQHLKALRAAKTEPRP